MREFIERRMRKRRKFRPSKVRLVPCRRPRENGDDMVRRAVAGEREDQVDPAVMREQQLEIAGRERHLRIDHDPAEGGGEARAEDERDVFGRAVGGDLAELDVLQPAVAGCRCAWRMSRLVRTASPN